jgi:hypothetical protein
MRRHIEVLQHTATAERKMRARRIGAACSGSQPLDHAAFTSPRRLAASRAKTTSPGAVNGKKKGSPL